MPSGVSRLPIMRQMSQNRPYPRVRYEPGTLILPEMTPARRLRFRRKIGSPTGPKGCREWQGAPGSNGYGLFQGSTKYRGYSFLAHRVAWALANEREPGSLIIRHKCDNPRCCEPTHLIAGTHKDNTADAITRDRVNFHGAKGRFGANANAARYSQDQRDAAIALRYQQHMPIAEICALIGTHRGTLNRWFSECERSLT